jgi:hypothetical protein
MSERFPKQGLASENPVSMTSHSSLLFSGHLTDHCAQLTVSCPRQLVYFFDDHINIAHPRSNACHDLFAGFVVKVGRWDAKHSNLIQCFLDYLCFTNWEPAFEDWIKPSHAPSIFRKEQVVATTFHHCKLRKCAATLAWSIIAAKGNAISSPVTNQGHISIDKPRRDEVC